MTLKTQKPTDLAAQFNTDEHAETVAYLGVDIPAIVDRGEDLDDRDMGRSLMAVMQITVKASDVAAPDYRDTVVVDSATWYVRRILEGAGDIWTLELTRDERPVL